MPYIPLEKLNEPSKSFIDEYVYYANKFCPGEKKNTKTVKKQIAKVKVAVRPVTKPTVLKKKTTAPDFPGISICVSAWKTTEYIEECLDSIARQTWFRNRNNYEIIVGIDGCQETLTKVKSIMHKYKNIRVYMMDKNVGTYVTCNTIMMKARFGWIMRFDSDDVMPEDMLEKIFTKNLRNANVIKYKYRNFGMKTNTGLANGSHIIKNSVWKRFGGYRDWQISADYDLLYRIADKVKTIELKDIYYNRRTHMISLMNTQGYEMKSDLRKKLDSFVVNESRKNRVITCVTEKSEQVYDQTPKLIVSFTTWKKRQDAVAKMIENFGKQTVQPDRIYCYLSSDEYGGENTPPCLQKLVDKKLIEIKWVKENTYCHKRHEVFKEHYNDYVFIIDDDILYDANYIADMYNAAVTHPDNVICYTGSKYEYGEKRQNTPVSENPSIKNCFLGGICCFPPRTFPIDDYFGNLDIRERISPKCDSSYLHVILFKNKTKVFLLHDRRERWINTIPDTQQVGVWEENKRMEAGTNINHMEHIVRQLIDAFGIKDEFRKIYPKFK